MAKRKLTDAERENFAARFRASKESSAEAKRKADNIQKDKIKIKTRTPEEIDKAIAKAKADPKFQKSMEKFQASQLAKGTQADHHVTTVKNVSKTISKGLGNSGVLGLAISGMAAYNQELKRLSDMKNQIN